MRLPTHGGLLQWDFKHGAHQLNVRVEEVVLLRIADGRLIRVLADWCSVFPGYHLYYPSCRQPSPAFALFVDALRFRDTNGR